MSCLNNNTKTNTDNNGLLVIATFISCCTVNVTVKFARSGAAHPPTHPPALIGHVSHRNNQMLWQSLKAVLIKAKTPTILA